MSACHRAYIQRLGLIAAALAVGGAALLSYVAARRMGSAQRTAVAEPRFLNVRPEVRYVGDDTCAQCHGEETDSYRRHPMGRSFAPMERWAADERYDSAAGNPFLAFGRAYAIERRGQRVWHREVYRDADGRDSSVVAAEVSFGMGSGTHGRSYLVNRDGFLFQSPVSWFTAKGRWEVSPGFTEDQHFERPIRVECLFCHCNDATPVPDRVNAYRVPLFRQHAIGCERCHGPGELHVRARLAGTDLDTIDPTIVNPRHLEPELREAVCQQCHLQGEKRVARRGRQFFDYRPGLPLQEFISVFTRPPELVDQRKAVGQVEQMYASRCFRASNGRLGCISCHDPHEAPAPEKRVAHYRARCLNCHHEETCRLNVAERRRKDGEDSCIACHMPRRNTSDIAHTALTDHRVLRRAEQVAATMKPPATPPPELPLAHFHRGLAARDDPDTMRDLGIAIVEVGFESGPLGPAFGRMALPYLQEAVRTWPEDVPAGEALAAALYLAGRLSDSLDTCNRVLALAADHERTLEYAGQNAFVLRRFGEAADYLQRAITLNPWSTRYRYQLAKVYEEKEDWPHVVRVCQEALRRNAHHRDCRMLLIYGLARCGRKDEARAEFQTLLGQHPPDPDKLRRWIDDLVR